MIATIVILAVFWKPLMWTGMAVYHAATDKGEAIGNAADYRVQIKAWFLKLWELIGPGSWNKVAP
jgi:uncharacterized membrane protein